MDLSLICVDLFICAHIQFTVNLIKSDCLKCTNIDYKSNRIFVKMNRYTPIFLGLKRLLGTFSSGMGALSWVK